MKALHSILASLALCFGFAVNASATDFISHRLGDLLPYSGTYIDWSVEGVSMEFDFGPAASGYNAFFLFHTYDPGGAQINWIGQTQLTPTTEEDRLATGVIGRASGGFYYATNGTCLGCTSRPPTITNIPITFLLEWTSARAVTLTLAGAQTGTFHLVAANFASQDDDQFLPGTWSATAIADSAAEAPTDPNFNYQSAALAIVQITALPSSVHFAIDATAPAGMFVPPATSRLYTLTCPNDSQQQGGGPHGTVCNDFRPFIGVFGQATDTVLWFDPVSKKSGVESATGQGGAEVLGKGHSASHYDLSLSAQVLRGHGAGYNNNNVYHTRTLLLVRVPDATVRDSADYQMQ